MNLLEEIAKILLGLTVPGLASGLICLFRWHNLTDLKIHDLDRDIKHIQRQQQQTSQTIAELDIQDEQITSAFRKDLVSIDRRLGRCETRIYVIEVKVNIPQTQA